MIPKKPKDFWIRWDLKRRVGEFNMRLNNIIPIIIEKNRRRVIFSNLLHILGRIWGIIGYFHHQCIHHHACFETMKKKRFTT